MIKAHIYIALLLLHVAIRYDRKYIAEYLIKCGADVNLGDEGGWTPLHYAASYRRLDIFRLLLEANADVDIPSKSGKLWSEVVYPPSESVRFIRNVRDIYIQIAAEPRLLIENNRRLTIINFTQLQQTPHNLLIVKKRNNETRRKI